jgi:hypothetical protein
MPAYTKRYEKQQAGSLNDAKSGSKRNRSYDLDRLVNFACSLLET